MENLAELNAWLPLIISILALSLVLYGFWRVLGRRGRLIVSPPRAFKCLETETKIVLELPLVFYNESATALVVDNLLLLARQEKTRMLFRFEYTRDELDAETHHWATQIALPGKETVMKVFSFQVNRGETELVAGSWNCTLLARFNNAGDLRQIARFPLNVSRLTGTFSAIDNTATEYQALVKRYTFTPAKKNERKSKA